MNCCNYMDYHLQSVYNYNRTQYCDSSSLSNSHHQYNNSRYSAACYSAAAASSYNTTSSPYPLFYNHSSPYYNSAFYNSPGYYSPPSEHNLLNNGASFCHPFVPKPQYSTSLFPSHTLPGTSSGQRSSAFHVRSSEYSHLYENSSSYFQYASSSTNYPTSLRPNTVSPRAPARSWFSNERYSTDDSKNFSFNHPIKVENDIPLTAKKKPKISEYQEYNNNRPIISDSFWVNNGLPLSNPSYRQENWNSNNYHKNHASINPYEENNNINNSNQSTFSQPSHLENLENMYNLSQNTNSFENEYTSTKQLEFSLDNKISIKQEINEIEEKEFRPQISPKQDQQKSYESPDSSLIKQSNDELYSDKKPNISDLNSSSKIEGGNEDYNNELKIKNETSNDNTNENNYETNKENQLIEMKQLNNNYETNDYRALNYETKEMTPLNKYETKESATVNNYETKEMTPLNNYETKEMTPLNNYATKEMTSLNNYETKEMTQLNNYGTKEMLQLNNYESNKMALLNNHETKEMTTLNNYGAKEIMPLNNYERKEITPINNYEAKEMMPLNDYETKEISQLNNYGIKEMVPINNYAAKLNKIAQLNNYEPKLNGMMPLNNYETNEYRNELKFQKAFRSLNNTNRNHYRFNNGQCNYEEERTMDIIIPLTDNSNKTKKNRKNDQNKTKQKKTPKKLLKKNEFKQEEKEEIVMDIIPKLKTELYPLPDFRQAFGDTERGRLIFNTPPNDDNYFYPVNDYSNMVINDDTNENDMFLMNDNNYYSNSLPTSTY